MHDWDRHLKDYLLSSRTLNFYIRMSKIPYFGKYFQMLIFRDLTMTYDVLINFKEAHECAERLVLDMIKECHIREVMEESKQ